MQNFEPTGAAAAMPGSAVPQLKRRLVISACLLIPLFYLGLGAAFGLPLPPFLTGDNAMWCGIVQLVLTVPVCWLNRSYFINGCKSMQTFPTLALSKSGLGSKRTASSQPICKLPCSVKLSIKFCAAVVNRKLQCQHYGTH